MATDPLFRKLHGLVPLRGLQLLCCAIVAGVALHVSSRLGAQADPAQLALDGFDAQLANDPARQAADDGLAQAVQIVVQRNDTLDRIFRRLQLSLADLASIRAVEAAREALDRIHPGDLLTFFRRGDQLVDLQRPLSINQTLHIRRDAADSFTASVEQVPLVHRTVTAGGSIDSSLFAAGSAAGLRDATIMQLADVFRWDVDFVLDLRAGDSFKVVYEQLEQDGRIVGQGDILAAEFVNDGRRYRAVRYVNANGETDYYTPGGEALRKAFLKAPLEFSRISSVFNPNRMHPILNTIRAHRGVDYAAPSGTPIRAAGAGRVQFRGVKGGFGNMVELAHAGGIVTRYGHMSRFAAGLAAGQRVAQGQVIGYVGMTGLATGPHLHFEYIDHGVSVDPQKAMRAARPGTAVPAAERARFDTLAAPLLAALDSIAGRPAGASARAAL